MESPCYQIHGLAEDCRKAPQPDGPSNSSCSFAVDRGRATRTNGMQERDLEADCTGLSARGEVASLPLYCS